MLLALLLAAAEPGPVAAERAFARDAQLMGQWEAFAKWAAPDAIMFTPQPTNAQAWLKGRKSPPVAVIWRPAKSFRSCDGKTAVNTGPWIRSGGQATGYFTTVWRRDEAGWRWALDHGDALAAPMPAGERPKVQTASCKGRPTPLAIRTSRPEAYGHSADGSLQWHWRVAPDGARLFEAELWDGARYRNVIANQVPAE